MKDFWVDLWENFVKPYFFVLIMIGIICWLYVYPCLFYIGQLRWYDIMGVIFISSEALAAIFHNKSKLVRHLEPFIFSDRCFEITFCVVTFSNLMHIEAAWPIFCLLLKTRGIYVALVFLGIGIYNYFTIPKS